MAPIDSVVKAEAKRQSGRPRGFRNKPKTAMVRMATSRSRLKEQKQTFVQEEILHAAATLIATRGFRAVTMDDISASMGFTKSVVYYYLKSKNDILWRIFSRMYESYFESITQITEMSEDPDMKLVAIIRQHALNVMKNRDWTAIYFREEAELDERQRREIARKKRQYDAVIEDIYCEGVERGMFLDIPPHIAVAGILGSCNWLYTWYNPEGPVSADMIADYYAVLLANGFRMQKNDNAVAPSEGMIAASAMSQLGKSPE